MDEVRRNEQGRERGIGGKEGREIEREIGKQMDKYMAYECVCNRFSIGSLAKNG
jgi:hypothetical protein